MAEPDTSYRRATSERSRTPSCASFATRRCASRWDSRASGSSMPNVRHLWLRDKRWLSTTAPSPARTPAVGGDSSVSDRRAQGMPAFESEKATVFLLGNEASPQTADPRTGGWRGESSLLGQGLCDPLI